MGREKGKGIPSIPCGMTVEVPEEFTFWLNVI
jgi:hypothetical protein